MMGSCSLRGLENWGGMPGCPATGAPPLKKAPKLEVAGDAPPGPPSMPAPGDVRRGSGSHFGVGCGITR